ncbi:MAG: hypothetical protein DELT_00388 [Desulfovibrio sp.]
MKTQHTAIAFFGTEASASFFAAALLLLAERSGANSGL